MKKYNKLVRDKIPEIINKKGEQCKTHTASDAEYKDKLKEKLIEEVNEFVQAETAEELADVLEVVEAIISAKQFDHNEILDIKRQKRNERGGFGKRIILDEAE